MPIIRPSILGSALVCLWSALAAAQTAAPTMLRCEYLRDPLALGERTPRFTWEWTGDARDLRQSAYEIRVGTSAPAALSEKPDLWASGMVRSPSNVNVEYAGKPLAAGGRYFWTVRTWTDGSTTPSAWSTPVFFGVGPLDAADWHGAAWIGDATPAPDGFDALPAPMLRREFELAGKPARATLYVAALGVYEARLNARRVGDQELAPEWTDYTMRVQYQAYDVTAQLNAGPNAIGVTLGDGWYAGRLGMAQQFSEKKGPRAVYGRQPRLLAQLVVELDGAKTVRIVTDGAWTSTLRGPIRSADLLDGQVIDARNAMPGWDAAGFKPAPGTWTPVAVDAAVHPMVVAQPNEPIRVIERLASVALNEPKKGVYVFDLGQNMAGRCRVRLKGKPGTVVTLRHAEAANDDGTIYTANLRGAPQVDHFTLAGDGAGETFEPAFTYHGFRFAELTGDIEPPKREDLEGVVVGSASPMVGTFECSSPMLNRLWKNILWTQHANMMSVPTDCPQRDERLGWTGDILSFAQTAMFNKDMAGFFTKWMQDVRDAQADNGRYADIAPHPFGKNKHFTGVPAWGDVGVFLPWEAYVNYDDRRLLERHLESAKRWVDWVLATNPELVWRNGRHNDYNDWLNGDTLIHDGWPRQGGSIPNEVFATAFFARSAQQVADMAGALGRADDAKRYADLSAKVRAVFEKNFVGADGAMPGDTQAGYALALNFDLAPAAMRPRLVERLLGGIHRYGDHLSTGFHSSHRAMIELTNSGHADVAYALVNDTRFPSWGYSIENGATTIWERWDGYVKGRGFQDPGMNSLNHWALGSVGEWMARVIVGINPDPKAPGYAHFTLSPVPGGGLTFARGGCRTVRGLVESSWRVEPSRTVYQFTVPPNTTATIRLAAGGLADVRESDQPVDHATGIHAARASDGAVVLEVGSGRYEFNVRR